MVLFFFVLQIMAFSKYFIILLHTSTYLALPHGQQPNFHHKRLTNGRDIPPKEKNLLHTRDTENMNSNSLWKRFTNMVAGAYSTGAFGDSDSPWDQEGYYYDEDDRYDYYDDEYYDEDYYPDEK